MPSNASRPTKYKGTSIQTRNLLKVNYDLPHIKLKSIKNGIINTSFAISINGKETYVLRVYRLGSKSLKDIEHELSLCKKLAEIGIPVPAVRSTNKGDEILSFTFKGEHWHAVLFTFLHGRHIKPTDKNLIGQAADIHARMHLALSKNNLGVGAKFVDELIHLIDEEFAISKRKLKARKMRGTIEQLSRIYEQVVKELKKSKNDIASLPSGFCHLDYDSTNVLTDARKISGVIDFDDMAVAPFIADVAFSLWWWLFYNNFDKKIFDQYLASYATLRKISQKEFYYVFVFLRARNIFLAFILFINQDEIDTSKLKRAVLFEDHLKLFNEKYSFSQTFAK